MKCRTKWTAATILGLGLLLLCFLVAERIRGEWMLYARIRGLKASGEVLSIAKLVPKRPPPDQNFVTDIFAITNELTTLKLDMMPPLLRLTDGGKGVVAARLKEWPNDKSTVNWHSIEPEVEKISESLEVLGKAVEKEGFDYGVNYTNGLLDLNLSPLAPVKKSCQALAYSAITDLRNDDLIAVHRDLTGHFDDSL